MADEELVATISKLVAEEHEVREAGIGSGETDDDRLRQIEETLDQCWDLLRQRRAARDAGLPDTSDVRSIDTVEGYQQ